eukprot:TRINITY_DN54346_c0_g1_i1.p1 TRINITY_DN54346_c0_g1~~TRINITY_DN54346_c0_g1_i1.p1  ORF type:complete len:116 (-),score=6.83 TRINITY_DN54346_c0_g1_i1:13-327(-)
MTSSARMRVEDRVDECEGLLVLGSTCTTYSALRIVKRVKERGRWVGMVSLGAGRADELVDDKWEELCEGFVPAVVTELERLAKPHRTQQVTLSLTSPQSEAYQS